MSNTAQQVPQPFPPPHRPPDIVIPMGQPLPKPPGIEWWIRRIRDSKYGMHIMR